MSFLKTIKYILSFVFALLPQVLSAYNIPEFRTLKLGVTEDQVVQDFKWMRDNRLPVFKKGYLFSHYTDTHPTGYRPNKHLTCPEFSPPRVLVKLGYINDNFTDLQFITAYGKYLNEFHDPSIVTHFSGPKNSTIGNDQNSQLEGLRKVRAEYSFIDNKLYSFGVDYNITSDEENLIAVNLANRFVKKYPEYKVETFNQEMMVFNYFSNVEWFVYKGWKRLLCPDNKYEILVGIIPKDRYKDSSKLIFRVTDIDSTKKYTERKKSLCKRVEKRIKEAQKNGTQNDSTFDL